ncbi:PfkB family carbohydrate kinase [Criblamydia sequanensis]|uniref:Kinase, pfkB family n=1 Tax=Candidatus Criblamydia sequanensis CRIB-18 TaxID=1437425 RepID=A0A090CZ94_9BACT|nr:PfkB family carbohydrate kinase [Criblamydia sequanensis]CDR34272.1 Kinase, pfkB family [Criblamydia sequanensis CRIB-18]
MELKSIQIACLGEAMVNLLSLEIGIGLAETTTFAKSIGGKPCHIALGLKRLGLDTALIGRVGHDPLGTFFKSELEKEGIDTSFIELDERNHTSLALVALDSEDPTSIALFRKESADQNLELDNKNFENIDCLIISPIVFIYPKLYESAKEAIKHLPSRSRLVLDLTLPHYYKAEIEESSKHEAPGIIKERIEALLPFADLVIATPKDLDALFGPLPIEISLKNLKRASKADILFIDFDGLNGYYPKEGSAIFSDPIPLQLLNNFGREDSFIAGFLSVWYRRGPIETALLTAEIVKALVMSREDVVSALPFSDEVEVFIEKNSQKNATLLHESHLKKEEESSICLLSFEHKGHFQELSEKHHRDEKDINHFKKLLFEGFRLVGGRLGKTRLGIIVDEQYGKEILHDSTRSQFFTSRAIDDGKSKEIDFLDGKHALALMLSWPRSQLVKVLCHLGDKSMMKIQFERLKELQEASQLTHHKFLIELYDKSRYGNFEETKKAMKICYEMGIRPTFWQIQPFKDLKDWEDLEKLMDEYDPISSHILLLGDQKALQEETLPLKRLREKNKKIHGFVVGRSLWGEIAEHWFGRRISDAVVINEISYRFNRLADTWENKPYLGEEFASAQSLALNP